MKILTIVGPTAVGKSMVALKVALQISGEIISADSRQIYKHLNIGTAKPTARQHRLVNIHLIDFVHPIDIYSCGQFARDAEMKIKEIVERGKTPIVCGGTGLYIKALFNPLHNLPTSNTVIKQRLSNVLKNHGVDHLFQRLKKIDPVWAKKITPKDKQRIIRGLEIFEMTGKPISLLLTEQKKQALYSPCYFGLNMPRHELYERINIRFDKMIALGLVAEIKGLLAKGIDRESNALRTIGYKELIQYLDAMCSLKDAIQKAKQRTRNFAKRQITWFNRIPELNWYDPREPKIIDTAIAYLKKC